MRGVPIETAVLNAARIRLRPILMTTLSMIFGVMPIALGLGAGAESRKPLGMAVVGGMLFSTLLTLVVVPAAYSVLARFPRVHGGVPADARVPAPAGAPAS